MQISAPNTIKYVEKHWEQNLQVKITEGMYVFTSFSSPNATEMVINEYWHSKVLLAIQLI